jgi:hypothetical protein
VIKRGSSRSTDNWLLTRLGKQPRSDSPHIDQFKQWYRGENLGPLAASLGVPTDRTLVRCGGGISGIGRTAYFGTWESDCDLGPVRPWLYRWHQPNEGPGGWYRVWLACAWNIASSVWVELRWDAVRGYVPLVGGIHGPITTTDARYIAAASQVLLHGELIDEPNPGGSPPRPHAYTQRGIYIAAIRERIYEQPDRLRRLRTAAPRFIADWLDVSERAMYEFNKLHRLSMTAIRRQQI